MKEPDSLTLCHPSFLDKCPLQNVICAIIKYILDSMIRTLRASCFDREFFKKSHIKKLEFWLTVFLISPHKKRSPSCKNYTLTKGRKNLMTDIWIYMKLQFPKVIQHVMERICEAFTVIIQVNWLMGNMFDHHFLWQKNQERTLWLQLNMLNNALSIHSQCSLKLDFASPHNRIQ